MVRGPRTCGRHGLTYQSIAELADLTPRYVSELMRMLDAGEVALQTVGEGRLSVREAARLGRESNVESRQGICSSGSARAESEGDGNERESQETGVPFGKPKAKTDRAARKPTEMIS